MLIVIGLYILISIGLVTWLVIEEDADVAGLEPAWGRRIVVSLLAPAGVSLIAVASLFEWMERNDPVEPWRDFWEDMKEAWNGR